MIRHGLRHSLAVGFSAAAGAVADTRPFGVVATRTQIGANLAGSVLTYMCRSFHYSREDLTGIQVLWANWIPNNNGESGSGSDVTITASVEYPAGTFTQLTFGGSTTGTIVNLNNLISDAAAVNIPNGAKFYVRWYWTGKVPYITSGFGGSKYVAGGDANVLGGSDLTMSGTVTDGATGINMWPTAIIGRTNKRRLCFMGDSRVAGAGDTGSDSSGDLGQFGRALGPSYAYMNLARAGDKASDMVAGGTRRAALANAYASDVLGNWGINDLTTNGQTAANTEARLVLIRAMVSTLPYYHATITPKTTSTDSWATTGNQTTVSGEANRVAVNNWLRANTPGFTGYIELADQMESARDSGVWKVDGTAFKYCTDGTHESTYGCKQFVISI